MSEYTRTEHGDEQERKRGIWSRLISWQTAIPTVSISIGLMGLMLGYLALREPQPEVTFETISETNVLDVRRPLQDLTIEFRGQDVQEQNLNLQIVTINVVNSGEVDILPNHYDQEDDWGITFENGEVIEARLVEANSDYLSSKVLPRRMGVDTVVFPKVIFEKDSAFAIEVLLLHPKNLSPTIHSVGKIAGIDEILVSTRPLATPDQGFLAQLFQGNFLVHFARAISYFVLAMVALGVATFLVVSIGGILNLHSVRVRKHKILASLTMQQIERNALKMWLIEWYGEKGMLGLVKLQDVTSAAEKLKFLSAPATETGSDADATGYWFGTRHFSDMEVTSSDLQGALTKLDLIGVLNKGEDGHVEFEEELTKAVDSLVRELNA